MEWGLRIRVVMLLHTTFPLGALVATPSALDVISSNDVADGLRRHASRDWGDLREEDRQANDRALIEGTRILSAYANDSGLKFWIITEWDRSVTTVLLPSDY
jgi:hypothetical protein